MPTCQRFTGTGQDGKHYAATWWESDANATIKTGGFFGGILHPATPGEPITQADLDKWLTNNTGSEWFCDECGSTNVYADAYANLNNPRDLRTFDTTRCDDCEGCDTAKQRAVTPQTGASR